MSNDQSCSSNRRAPSGFAACGFEERGASAIEFALIIPFLLMLIVSIIEMSNLYFMRNQLSEIARDATRRFAVGALNEAEVKTFVLKRLTETTGINGEVDVAETEVDDIVDVTLTLGVAFADVLMFDELIKDLWANAPTTLSVNATMMKQ